MTRYRSSGGGRARRIVGGLLAVGGLLLFWALWEGELGLVVQGVPCSGVVERVEHTRRGERAFLRYTTRDGTQRTCRGMTVTRLVHEEGDRVPLRYDPSSPSFARIESWQSLYRPLLIGFCFSSVVLAGGIVLMVWRRKGGTTSPIATHAPGGDRVPWPKKAALPALLLLFVGGGATLVIVNGGFEGAGRTERIDRALPEARALLAAFPVPDGAAPRGPAQEAVGSGKKLWFTITQEYDAPGHFSQARLHYYERLQERGWRPYDQEGWDGLDAEYCKPPYIVAVESSDPGHASAAGSRHRHVVRLEWRDGWNRCQ